MFSIRIVVASTVAGLTLAAAGTAFAANLSGGNVLHPNDSATTTTSPITPIVPTSPITTATVGGTAIGLTPVVPLSGALATSGEDSASTTSEDSSSSAPASSSDNSTSAPGGGD
jgi:hypothetical protein